MNGNTMVCMSMMRAEKSASCKNFDDILDDSSISFIYTVTFPVNNSFAGILLVQRVSLRNYFDILYIDSSRYPLQK